jgi:hypothetical protein
LQNLSLTESSQVPVIKINSCQGPTGMEEFLNQQIASLYSNPARIQSAFAGEIQKFLDSQVAKVVASLSKPVMFDLLGAHVVFTPTTGSNLTSGTWVLNGPLSIQAVGGGTGTKTVPQGYTNANLTDVRASGFVFANTLWSEILAFADRAGLLTKQYKGTDIPQFQNFLQNRFEQFLVWSDLMNFSTSSLFYFNFDAAGPVSILSQTNQSSGVQWSVSAPLDVLMYAPVTKKNVPYVEFQSNTPVTATLLAQAKNGSLNVAYSITNLDMNYAFRKEFLKYRSPMFGIGMSMIDSSVQSALTNKVWTYTMPDSASPLPGYRINFKDVIFGKKTFRFEMGLQKK